MSDSMRSTSLGDQDVNPFVSVIIPVFNDSTRLGLCLTALLDQDYPADRFEIIVVDNNSTDQPARAIPLDSRIHLKSESHPGSYAARNTGLESARGAIIAFTDSDCLPHTDWLRKGVDALRFDQPSVDAVGGEIRIFFNHGRQPRSAPEHFEALNEFQQKKYVEEWFFAATANLFVYAEVIQRVGRFDAKLKSGGDLDFGNRLRRSGGRLVYRPDVLVEHPARSGWRELGRKTIRVANGIADRTDRTPGASLNRAWREGRGGMTIWFRVWTSSRPSPRRPTDKIRYAAAFTYVRALRAAVHLHRATSKRKRNAGDTTDSR